jgi:hypothetical protein
MRRGSVGAATRDDRRERRGGEQLRERSDPEVPRRCQRASGPQRHRRRDQEDDRDEVEVERAEDDQLRCERPGDDSARLHCEWREEVGHRRGAEREDDRPQRDVSSRVGGEPREESRAKAQHRRVLVRRVEIGQPMVREPSSLAEQRIAPDKRTQELGQCSGGVKHARHAADQNSGACEGGEREAHARVWSPIVSSCP